MGRTALWYPAGSTFDDEPVVLDDGAAAPMFVMKGAEGLEAPKWLVEFVDTPGIPGTRFGRATVQARTIKLPVYLRARTRAQMRMIKNDLIDALEPESGPGVLVIGDGLGDASGEMRCIDAVYMGGLEGDEDTVSVGPGPSWWQFMLTFTGLDLWYAMEPSVGVWTLPAPPATWPLAFPIQFAPTTLVSVAQPLAVGGTYATWPVVTLTAPFTSVRLTNDRSGDTWKLQRSVADAGQDVTVDTRPGRVRVRTATGQNVYGQLVSDSVLFPLLPGDTVTVDMSGPGPSSAVRVEAFDRFRSAP